MMTKHAVVACVLLLALHKSSGQSSSWTSPIGESRQDRNQSFGPPRPISVLPLSQVKQTASHVPDTVAQKRSASGGNELGDTPYMTRSDLQKVDLTRWEAPLFIRRNYPYYLAGYDDESRPVWICELGKMNLRKLVEDYPDSVPLMDKYIQQSAARIIKSIENASTVEYPVTEAMYIVDMDGLDISQVAHLPTVNYCLRLARLYSKLIIDHLGGTVVINANYLAMSAMNLFRPLFAGAWEKVEVYGTRREAWLPILRAKFPRHILPEWYGGLRSFKPVAVFG